MARYKNIGKMLAERIAGLGYQTYSEFLKEFKKYVWVTLSCSTLSSYLHGTKPSLERFHALADFLGFTEKEKQRMENIYGGLRSSEPFRPSSDQSKRIGTHYKRTKKVERLSLPKNGKKVQKQKRTKKRPHASSRARVTKDLLLYTRFIASYKEVMKKVPSKKAKLLLFELALQ